MTVNSAEIEINTTIENPTKGKGKGKQTPKIDWNDRSCKSFQEIIPQVTGTEILLR
jgi:hypothetical protein